MSVPSNQKMNGYLKEITDLCAMNKQFTIAISVYLDNGVSIEKMVKMLDYSYVLGKNILKDMRIVDEKYKIGLSL